jgi:formate/nitrite transporter FocA (FNT family)
MYILWIIVIIGAILGALVVFLGILSSSGAPQEAAAAAIGVSLAVIPYCLARAVLEIKKS